MPYAAPDRISKMIPPGFQGSQMTIEKALEQSAELGLAYKTEPETKRLLDVARKLEGVARHASVHAAGVVISDKPLVEYTPLQRESKGERVITQYDMYTVGEYGVGLMKMDFLGLRNLTIMSQALKFIKEVRGETIDLQKIPLDDKKTYKALASGETTGVFQLESAGMRRYIKELKPTNIFDVMAMVALFRPGPMQTIPEFIKRKHDPRLIMYPDPRLKEVLSQSYGIIAYQDDVLLTAITLAGYSWGDADKLRKAVGKKIPTEMKKQKEKFVAGCVTNGMTKVKAEEIFNLIEPFAGYGFNKAHAACYATIAYDTAYLKANYPVEFMTAVLTAESRANTGPARDEKIASMVAECRRTGLVLLPPDINKSEIEFSIEDGKIRFGLSAVKNVGSAAIESIIEARKMSPFVSLSDVVARVDTSKVNKKTFESLIKTGALDKFGSRAPMLAGFAQLLEQSHKNKKSAASGQVGLFGEDDASHVFSDSLPDIPELTQSELLGFEKELLGFYLTMHPLEPYRKTLAAKQLATIVELSRERVGERIGLAGIIVSVKKIVTRAGNHEMAFAKVEDLTGVIEVVVFPKIFSRTSDLWKIDRVIELTGKLDEKEDRLTVLVDDVKSLV
jgi:DNA polymerase-3 subunit alpha